MFYWPVRVYYEDTDSGGVVYYANYLKYLERARSEWLRNLGYEQDVLLREHGLIFAVRSVSIDYLRPARFNELLDVGVDLAGLRAASLMFSQQVSRRNDGDGELLCTARVEVVCCDASGLKARRIPEFMKTEIQRAG